MPKIVAPSALRQQIIVVEVMLDTSQDPAFARHLIITCSEMFLQNCPQCLIVNETRRKLKPPLHFLLNIPFRMSGGYNGAANSNCNVAVFQDIFSKWPMAFATINQTERNSH